METLNSNNTKGKVPFISKLAYGFGDVGCNFSWSFVVSFLMIFYTDVFGIGMAAVATLMLVSRFWDAFNDPLIGSLSDRTKSRWALSSVVTLWCSDYCSCTGALFLGSSRHGLYGQDYLYEHHLRTIGIGIHLCQLAVWYPMWSHDAAY